MVRIDFSDSDEALLLDMNGVWKRIAVDRPNPASRRACGAG